MRKKVIDAIANVISVLLIAPLALAYVASVVGLWRFIAWCIG